MTVGNSNPPAPSDAKGPAPSPNPGGPPAGKTRPTIAVVFTAVFVTNLDLFVVNVALPKIGTEFNSSITSLSWVLNAYAIVFAALLVVAGRLADRNGHRGGFILGLGVFTLGSVLCAAATDTTFLVSARVVQAIGAAILLPTSLALLLASTPIQKRAVVVRAWSAVGGVAAALGPVVGGALVEASWRWVFLINVPVGIFAIVLGLKVLPQVKDAARGAMPDLFGALLLTGSIAGLCLGLVEGNAWGWSSGRIIGSLAGSVVLMLAFLASSARHKSPIVELPLLKIRAFNTPTVGIMLFTASFSAMVLSAALWAQNAWGYSALKTGLAIVPGPMLVPPMAALAGPLSKRIGTGMVAAIGNLIFAGGMAIWALEVTLQTKYLAALLPGTLLVGIGVGLVLPTLTAAGAVALPPQRFATGSGILNMARQVGAVLGVAIFVSVLGSPRTPNDALKGFQHGWWTVVAMSVLAAVFSLAVPKSPPQAMPQNATPTPQPQKSAA